TVGLQASYWCQAEQYQCGAELDCCKERDLLHQSPPLNLPTYWRAAGGEAGTAALASARAACRAASLVWSSEVLSTVPPSPLSRSRTLSAVTLRTSTKSAAVPGWMAAAVSFIHLSSMPISVRYPLSVPEAAPSAAPASGIKKIRPISAPQKVPVAAPKAVVLIS